MDLSVLISSFLPVAKTFLMIQVGVFLRKSNLVSEKTMQHFGKINLSILVPLFFFTNIGPNVSEDIFSKFLPISINCVVQFFLTYLTGLYVANWMNLPKHIAYLFSFVNMYGNHYALPIPIMQGICDSYGTLANNVTNNI